MAAGLVIGICSNSDVKALEDALSAQQIDLEKVKVFGGDGDDLETSPLDFIEVFSETESISGLSDDMTRGTGVLADSGGTAVPGLTGSEAAIQVVLSGGRRVEALPRRFRGARR